MLSTFERNCRSETILLKQSWHTQELWCEDWLLWLGSTTFSIHLYTESPRQLPDARHESCMMSRGESLQILPGTPLKHKPFSTLHSPLEQGRPSSLRS